MINKNTRRQLLVSTASATLVGLAGCTSGSETNHTGDNHDDSHGKTETENNGDHHGHGVTVPDGPSETATVKMKTKDGKSHFEPHVVWVQNGGTVTFQTESGTHTATAYHPENNSPQRIPENATGWDSGMKSADDEPYKKTFTVTGIHDFYCKPHQAQGMIGTVIVGKPKKTEQPGLADPQTDLPADARSKIETLNKAVIQGVDSLD